MNKNEKLTHNAVRARKAQKKRANKQDTPKKNKGWCSRLFVFIGCLLLVSVLAVPCFADEPIENTDSVVGTWIFDPILHPPVRSFLVSFTCTVDNATNSYVQIQYEVNDDMVYYSTSVGDYTDPVYTVVDDGWYSSDYRTITITEEPTDAEFITWLRLNAHKVESEEIVDVWSAITNWLISAISSVQSIFYADGSLTLLGSLSVIGVGVALSFLLVSVITRFLHLRG